VNPFALSQRQKNARGTVQDVVAILLLCALSLAFYRQIALTNLILSGADATTYFYPYRAYAAQAIRGGRIPLWNPYLFMGVPFLANPQTGVFYPLNLALCWLPAPKLVAWSIVLHVAMAAVFAYLYARHVLRLLSLPALLGASAFAFGGYLSGQAEHVNQLNVCAWFPLLLLLWEGRQRARWPALLGMGAVIGIGLLAGHTQSSYISLVGLLTYALVPSLLPQRDRERGEKRLRALRVSMVDLWQTLWQLGFALLMGLGLAAVQLLPTLELSRLSIRSGGLSYREAVAFSLKPLPRLLRYTFLPPWGRNLSDVFGGDFFTEYLAYVGVVPLLLALAVFVLRLLHAVRVGRFPLHERYQGTWLKLASLAGLGVLLALGLYNPLYYLLYKVVPGFGLFRVPARWLFLYAFGAAMPGPGKHSPPTGNRVSGALFRGTCSPPQPSHRAGGLFLAADGPRPHPGRATSGARARAFPEHVGHLVRSRRPERDPANVPRPALRKGDIRLRRQHQAPRDPRPQLTPSLADLCRGWL
jgi:hypothetical protein